MVKEESALGRCSRMDQTTDPQERNPAAELRFTDPLVCVKTLCPVHRGYKAREKQESAQVECAQAVGDVAELRRSQTGRFVAGGDSIEPPLTWRCSKKAV